MGNRKGQYNDSEDRQLCRALFDDWADLERSYLGVRVVFIMERADRRGHFYLTIQARELGPGMGGRIHHSIRREWPNSYARSLLAELASLTWELEKLCQRPPNFLPE